MNDIIISYHVVTRARERSSNLANLTDAQVRSHLQDLLSRAVPFGASFANTTRYAVDDSVLIMRGNKLVTIVDKSSEESVQADRFHGRVRRDGRIRR